MAGESCPLGSHPIFEAGNQRHGSTAAHRKALFRRKAVEFALDVEDFDETKRSLKEMGIEFLEAPSNMGAGRQLWVVDPDGNTVELKGPATRGL